MGKPNKQGLDGDSFGGNQMSSNRFGDVFTITTFGESHGKMIGVVIDGCPAGVDIDEELIVGDMKRRRPGRGKGVSERKESDEVEIVSGIHENTTTGAPITLLIKNSDARKTSYEPIKNIYRPGHANYSYMQKYGLFDHRGGGRASARETAARVAAGAIAKQVIPDVKFDAKVVEVGGMKDHIDELLAKLEEEGDSAGAVIECRVSGLFAGIGDPVYDKLEARLASAMLSIPATKGFEIGSGFEGAKMRGSEHNDLYKRGVDGSLTFDSNNHGGVLGGITTGEDVIFRIAFKPTSSIKKPQESVDFENNPATLTLPKCSRHDVCVALRAPPIVEAMSAIVFCDLTLKNRCSKISY